MKIKGRWGPDDLWRYMVDADSLCVNDVMRGGAEVDFLTTEAVFDINPNGPDPIILLKYKPKWSTL